MKALLMSMCGNNGKALKSTAQSIRGAQFYWEGFSPQVQVSLWHLRQAH